MNEAYEEQDIHNAQVAFSLISRLLYQEPEKDFIAYLIEEDIFDEAPFGMDNDHVMQGLELFRTWIGSTNGLGMEQVVDELRSEWFTVLVGAGTPKAPSWESYYIETNNQLFGRTTLEVRKWYRDFGLVLARQNKEPDDHLGLMVGFVSHLIAGEISAREAGDTHEAARITRAQRDFMAEHILPWLAVWHYNLRTHASSDFYRGLAELAFGFCEAYVARFGIVFDCETRSFSCREKEVVSLW